jgi:hypothetical protein
MRQTMPSQTLAAGVQDEDAGLTSQGSGGAMFDPFAATIVSPPPAAPVQEQDTPSLLPASLALVIVALTLAALFKRALR